MLKIIRVNINIVTINRCYACEKIDILKIITFLVLQIFIFSIAASLCFPITFHKPYIACLEIWMIELWTDGMLNGCKLWTVRPFDFTMFNNYNVKYQMDDYPADSCAISPTVFLLNLCVVFESWKFRSFCVP